MIISAQLISYWKQVPETIRKFLVRGLFLFFIWKAFYIFYVGPKGTWNETLTQATGRQTVAMMNALRNTDRFTALKERTYLGSGEERQFGSMYKSTLQYDGVTFLYIYDSCNGLELLVLYAGFLLCYPAHWLKKSVFLAAGLPFIFFINVIRCSALAHVQILRPEFLDFAHHYLFKVVVYMSILLLWWLFSLPFKSLSNQQASLAQ